MNLRVSYEESNENMCILVFNENYRQALTIETQCAPEESTSEF